MHNEKDGGWIEIMDDLEAQLLGICDGNVGLNYDSIHGNGGRRGGGTTDYNN